MAVDFLQSPPITAFHPKARVARFKTKFLHDGAVSRNGRMYPKDAVDRLVQSAQEALLTPNADPLTCYLSHTDANSEQTLSIAGKITRVWKEGPDAYASIDMPDTQAGREAATLARHGYLRTSLRAGGAMLTLDPQHKMPVVAGANLHLQGIDFTTTPGIETVTVEDVVFESHEPQSLTEVFAPSPDTLIVEDVTLPSPSTTEHDVLPPPAIESLALPDLITEVGKRLSSATSEQLKNAHDALATVLVMNCRPLSPDDDAGTDDAPPDDAQDESTPLEAPMTAEEAMRVLQEAGYAVQPPQTPEEKLQEQLQAEKAALEARLQAERAAMEARLKESQDAQTQQLEEIKALLAQRQPATPLPQRTSLVEGANTGMGASVAESTLRPRRSAIQQVLESIPVEDLVDRSKPLPAGIPAEEILKQCGRMMILRHAQPQ